MSDDMVTSEQSSENFSHERGVDQVSMWQQSESLCKPEGRLFFLVAAQLSGCRKVLYFNALQNIRINQKIYLPRTALSSIPCSR